MIIIKFVVPLNEKNIASKEVRFGETEAGHLAAIAMAIDWLKGKAQDCHDIDESIIKKPPTERKFLLSPKDNWRWYEKYGWLWDKADMPIHYTPQQPKPSRPYAKSSGMTAMPEAEIGGLMPSPNYSEEPAYSGSLAQAAGAVPSVTDMKFLKDLITKNIAMRVSSPNTYGEAEKDLHEVVKVLQDGVEKATETQLRIRVHSECKDDGEQRTIVCLHSNCPAGLPRYQTPVFIVAFGLGPKGYPIKTFTFDEYDVFKSGKQIGELKDKGELCNFVLGLTYDDRKGISARCISVEAVNLLHRMDRADASRIQKAIDDAIDDLNAIPIPKEE